MSPQNKKVIGYISLVAAIAIAVLGVITIVLMPPNAKYWQGYEYVANFLDKMGYNIVLPMSVFLLVGIFILVGEVKINAKGIVEKKYVLWLSWSLFISAFLVSSPFRIVATLAWIIGWFVESDKNWKYALAIVCLCYVLFKQ